MGYARKALWKLLDAREEGRERERERERRREGVLETANGCCCQLERCAGISLQISCLPHPILGAQISRSLHELRLIPCEPSATAGTAVCQGLRQFRLPAGRFCMVSFMRDALTGKRARHRPKYFDGLRSGL